MCADPFPSPPLPPLPFQQKGHKSRSVYVAFPVVDMSEGLQEAMKGKEEEGGEIHFAIWTTTPWTLPANAAIAVNADLEYAVAREEEDEEGGGGGRCFVVASDLLTQLEEKVGRQLVEIATVTGDTLAGSTYKHPLFEERGKSPVIVGGDYITTESGTGLVHTAPGHGAEDYIGKRRRRGRR